jgi:hypothetical protein
MYSMMILVVLVAFVVGVPGGLLVWWAVHAIGKRRQAQRERPGFSVHPRDEHGQ